MVHLATTLIHADDKNNRVSDVAPPINVATTYRYDNDNLIPWAEQDEMTVLEGDPVYSREAHPNCTRLESIFSQFLEGEAVVYNSGCSAFHAALVHINPKRIFMGQSYFGCHAIADMVGRNYGLKKHTLEEIEQYAEKGDLVHLETPVNPFGTSIDIQAIADRAHAKGALLMIDSTFAPPPLQKPWDFGADIIMHSATKFFGGHSDLLSGVLVVKDVKSARELRHDRIHLGTIVGNLESFLLMRSMRTFEMRVLQQSRNATEIMKFLSDYKGSYDKVIRELHHSSLQSEPFVAKQLAGGQTPVFSVCLMSQEQCKQFVSKLKYFQHATSLGGVESLVEWRAMSDDTIDQTLIRFSIGCENASDLIEDVKQALDALQNA
ncbi:hypothetical protein DAKH74_044200 [Maudiozyma humilis]|uniref:Cystathionine beta-lyase n=1 Tax=Maudiozyma humilis TaxID=51915 RepID=A0AAV5S1Q9_MAUHU|nr:hypothetical protein DAKH74_044200 [Kazachstania humilis]